MRYVTTLLALFFALSASLSAQVITGATVTPNPAYSNTPVTVNVHGYLADGCQYIANVSSAWTGNTLSIYMTFGSTGGPFCPAIVTYFDQQVSVGTLAPNSYTVKVYGNGALAATQYFTVYATSDGNTCNNPLIAQCGSSIYSNNSLGASLVNTWYQNGTAHPNMTGPEMYHRLTLSTQTTLTVSMTGLSQDLDVYLMGSCSNASMLAFSENADNQSEQFTITLSPGAYYLVVDGWNYAVSNYTLSVQCTPYSTCAAPTLSQMFVTNLGSTTARLNCSAPAVTYSWRWRRAGTATWTTSGSNGQNFLDINGLNPSTLYEFQVSIKCSNGFISEWSSSQTFTTTSGGPNSCLTPALLSCGGTFNGNNNSGKAAYSTYKMGNGYLYGYYGREMIHRFTITSATSVTLNLYGLSADLGLIVLSQCDPNFGFNFSDNAGTLGEIITFNNLPAGTYYAIVDSKASYITSNYSLALTCGNPPPSNDEPCGASQMQVYSGCYFTTVTNVNATQTLNPPLSGIGCNTAGGPRDIWLRFVTPSTGKFRVSTQAGNLWDAVVAAYAGNDCNNLSYIGCLDDSNGNPMPQATITAPPGTVIWLRYWGKNGTTGSFSICAFVTTQPSGGGSGSSLETGITSLEQPVEVRSSSAEELREPAAMRIFPVPATDQITLTTELGESAGEVTVYIFDMAGHIVRERSTAGPADGIFTETFDVQDLPKGIYEVRLKAREQTQNGRFLKVE